MMRAILFGAAFLFLLDAAGLLLYRRLPPRGLAADLGAIYALIGSFLLGMVCVAAAAVMRVRAGFGAEAEDLRRPWLAVSAGLAAILLAVLLNLISLSRKRGMETNGFRQAAGHRKP